MLQLLQERLSEFEHGTPNGPRLNWRSKPGPGSLRGACVRGDLDMVCLCLYPSSRVLPEGGDKEKEMLILECKLGSMERSPVKSYILVAEIC